LLELKQRLRLRETGGNERAWLQAHTEEDHTMKGSKLVAAAALVSAFISGPAEADHLTASLTFDPDASRSQDRLVITVTGTYTCGPMVGGFGGFAFAFIDVSQAAGQSIIRGFAGFEPQCDDTLQTFEVEVGADNRPWKGGKARAHGGVFVEDCTEFECHSAFGEATTTIRVGGGGSS